MNTIMSDSERIHVDVSVALVTDDHQRVLVTFNDDWGMFTLPMTRPPPGPPPERTIDAGRDPRGGGGTWGPGSNGRPRIAAAANALAVGTPAC